MPCSGEGNELVGALTARRRTCPRALFGSSDDAPPCAPALQRAIRGPWQRLCFPGRAFEPVQMNAQPDRLWVHATSGPPGPQWCAAGRGLARAKLTSLACSEDGMKRLPTQPNAGPPAIGIAPEQTTQGRPDPNRSPLRSEAQPSHKRGMTLRPGQRRMTRPWPYRKRLSGAPTARGRASRRSKDGIGTKSVRAVAATLAGQSRHGLLPNGRPARIVCGTSRSVMLPSMRSTSP